MFNCKTTEGNQLEIRAAEQSKSSWEITGSAYEIRRCEVRAGALELDLKGWKMWGNLGCPKNKSNFNYKHQIVINLNLFRRLPVVHN